MPNKTDIPTARARLPKNCSLSLFAALLAGLTAGPFAAPASAQTNHLEPVRIDRAVAQFTGKAVGMTGGARHNADTRLRLSNCLTPLKVEWHGRRMSTVKVTCQDRAPWHIFIAIKSAPKPQPAPDSVRRGDAVTILVEGKGFTIRRSGEAMQAGAVGDWISVKTARKSEPINAQIVRPGLVVIPL